MSTHSRIGIEEKSGRVRSIYCHFDGSLEGVGDVLSTHYRDEKKIRELIALGGLSSLEDTPDNSEAYFRDRGDDELDIKEAPSRERFLYSNSGEEYYYLWSCEDSRWYYATLSHKVLKPLYELPVAPEPVEISGTQYELEALHKALCQIVGAHQMTEVEAEVGSTKYLIKKSKSGS